MSHYNLSNLTLEFNILLKEFLIEGFDNHIRKTGHHVFISSIILIREIYDAVWISSICL